MSTTPLLRTATRLVGELAPAWVARPIRHRLTHPRRHAPRPWETEGSIAPQRISFRFGLGGLRWGQTGPVVLALHGWEGRASQYRRIAEAVVGTGRQFIALDAPAHGDSPGDEAHPAVFAEALIEAATEIRDVETVIGHSMGAGATAYALARGLSAERAVLIAGPSSFEDVVRQAGRHAGLGPRAERRLLEEMESRTGLAPAALDIAQIAPRIEIPTLVVHDEQDAMVRFRHAQRIAAQLPDARLLRTQGLGHWRVLTDPATVAQIAAFIVHAPLRQAA